MRPYRRPSSSTKTKSRSSATPWRPTSTSSGCTSARPFTGAIESRATVATPLRYRGRVPFRRVELEDPEVLARDVDRDVVDRDVADRALERARVRVPVQGDVGPELGDRRGEPLAAEIRPDPLRLAVQGVRGRRVVEQRDADVAVRDLLQRALERVDLLAGLRVDAPQERLAEVGQGRAREA